MSERNRDPGAPLEGQGIPDIADDETPKRYEVPEPGRFPTPTESPAVSTDFGTTAEEQASGESLERKLTREERQPTGEPRREGGVDEWPEEIRPDENLVEEDVADQQRTADDVEGDEVDQLRRREERDLSPYERDVHAADEDLTEYEQQPGTLAD